MDGSELSKAWHEQPTPTTSSVSSAPNTALRHHNVPGQNGARTIAPAPTPCWSADHRELLAQNQFARRCHRGEQQMLVAQDVQRGYSSVGEQNNSSCAVDPHLVSR